MDSIRSDRWLSIVMKVAKETMPDAGPTVVESLAKAMGIEEGMARSMLEGMEVLAEYAAAENSTEAAAVDTEGAAVRAALTAVRPMLEARLQRQMDQLDARSCGETKCLGCDATAESQGRRSRPWISLTGKVELTRRYAYCEACKHGRAPAQESLGMSASKFTPRLEEICTLMATTVAHGMAVELVDKMLGIQISELGMQQMVERRAQRLEEMLLDESARHRPYDDTGLPVAKQSRPDDSVTTVAEVAYLEMDGVVPMTREELTAAELSDTDRRRQRRAKKEGARGGKGRRYRLVGREVKNAVLYTADDCVKESDTRDAITDKRYVSHLGGWQPFAELLWVALLRGGFDKAKRLVVLSDGSEWIRSLCSWLPIATFLILDLFHVKHRIWEVANILYGDHTPQARRWAEAQCALVEAGDAEKVIATLRRLSPNGTAKRKAVTILAAYLEGNLDRMNYPAYREMGLRVGSGAVESANYHVTGARLKLQGMRWSEQGAREMAYLRADLFNGKWEGRTRQLWTV